MRLIFRKEGLIAGVTCEEMITAELQKLESRV